MHAVRERADMQPPPVEVRFLIAAKAVRVCRVAGIAAEQAKLGHRLPARHTEHLLFVEEMSLLVQLLPKMAENGRGLITDLSSSESLGDTRQRLQLFANTEPVGSRGARHVAV